MCPKTQNKQQIIFQRPLCMVVCRAATRRPSSVSNESVFIKIIFLLGFLGEYREYQKHEKEAKVAKAKEAKEASPN